MLWKPLSLSLLAVCSCFALSQEPTKSLEYYSLVRTFFEQSDARKFEDAAATAEKALAISKIDGDVWFRYAQILLRLDRYQDCVDAFLQARKLGAFFNKMPAEAAFGIASAYAGMNKNKEAVDWLETSFNEGYRDITVFRNSQFAALKGDPRYDAMVADVDTTKMSRDEGLAYDLWFMDRELRRIHYDPYRVTPKAVLDKELQAIKDAIPNLANDEFYVRARKYVAMIGDGHTSLRAFQWTGTDQRQLPVSMTKFTDGVFVTTTTEEQKALMGQRLVSMNGHSVDDLWAVMRPLVSRESEYVVVAQVPVLLTYASLLKGTGVAKGDDVQCVFEKKDGTQTNVDLKLEQSPKYAPFAVTMPNKPLYLQHPGEAYWYTYLPEAKTVYMQYNSVRNDPNDPMPDFMDRIFKETQGKQIDKFVVDVRFNGGGNSFLNAAFEYPLMRNSSINKRGHLFIITGRQTFSAAQNFATDFLRDSEAIFVGEPTGSSPNAVGESNHVVLPYTKMRLTVSDLYWERSWPLDHRTYIPPDVPTEMSSEMFFAGRDPAMEAILAFKGS